MKDLSIVFESRVFNVGRLTVVLPGAGPATRDVVLHAGSVIIVPCVDEEHVCLIRNYRWAVRETLYELPAGTLEPDEDPDHAAPRELQEETGYRAGRFTKLLEFYTSPGFLTERMHLYLAEQLTPGPTRLEPGEEITTEVVDWQDAQRLIAEGKITDGKTLVGLLYYQALRIGSVATRRT